MSNIFMTGFEWGTKFEMTWWDHWDFCSIVSDMKRSGNYSLRMYGFYASIACSIPTSGGVYVQFAFRTDGGIGSAGIGHDIFHWYTNQGDTRCGFLTLTDTGQLRLNGSNWKSGNEATYVVAFGKKHLQINKWYVIELAVFVDEGVLECRIDGVPDCRFEGKSYTAPPVTNPDAISIEGVLLDSLMWSHPSAWIDDIVVNDRSFTDAGQFNNSWPGCLKVVLLRPIDNGDTIQWIASDEGLNYDMVNEVPYDPNQFVYTTALDVLDLYYLERLPIDAADVSIVRGDAWCFKDSGSETQDRTLKFMVKPGLTIGASTAQHVELDYHLVTYPFDYNPITELAWTTEEVNDMQAGISPGSGSSTTAYAFELLHLTMALYSPTV